MKWFRKYQVYILGGGHLGGGPGSCPTLSICELFCYVNRVKPIGESLPQQCVHVMDREDRRCEGNHLHPNGFDLRCSG